FGGHPLSLAARRDPTSEISPPCGQLGAKCTTPRGPTAAHPFRTPHMYCRACAAYEVRVRRGEPRAAAHEVRVRPPGAVTRAGAAAPARAATNRRRLRPW